MPDDRSRKRAASTGTIAGPAVTARRPEMAWTPGSSVHASLASEIGLRIVRGDYPPGTILPNEAKWSETFNVSRSAVREAIKMLMAKSLLASRPKIGSWVEPKERWNLLDRDVLAWYATAPDRELFLKTVQEFRHIIEPEASAFAAMRRSEEQMAEISQACREMGAATNLQERTRADTRFHLAILRASGNELLVPLGVLIESALDHLFVFVTREHSDQRRAQSLHEAIEKSIRLKRPAAARNAVHRLLANTDEVIQRSRR
ncbi:FadR family transcriptional regulator [Mesorhizobium sp. M4B.F.Ca.ET.215.01.1.1]|uniref:FadR/GntR family transcriptional regulator n=4 Tax=Phyllobacteriaceae TaxID=69277 RepID=UPI000FD3F3EC|nr:MULTISPECIES: FadR/GntR family transcriptional regulator [unclassified Mesorhizobium]RUW18331.1 FadR family transcriptional regulator [Mesorhizobium sp. M4B.F.Ca.ET.013.02.1.1]RWA65879.1 MAG: FadR family transcriptional regulator [Mesorhizobium sp.]RWF62351.1 MAG: FadR family transcriptional regulator [Mesorhizobium sp.]TGQ10950.1 FadR family transcriptional regulator [Mesorhizobium sp. M4B.F.Ca.ET.215.01.1.1]TGQ38782.1 FadR family transcriptional regulator [Mesorhizobium sp. M4B.F.Ca.ET.21